MNEIVIHYAEALLSLAREENKLSLYQEEVKELRKIIKDNPDFITLIDSKFLTQSERKEELDNILKGFDQDIVNFLKVIISHNRVDYLLDILQAFNSLCNEDRGIVEGLIYSAFPLSESTLKEITTKISKVEGREIELIPRIDPSLIGGVKVTINSHVYDGSIKNQLEKMQIDLLGKES